jgi:hypothetical protein
VEVNTAILCACTMTLKPLVGKWFPAMVEPPESGFDGRDPYSADGAGPPLTVGSKPSRGQLRVRTSYDSWLRDFRDFPRKPADVQVVALNDGLNRENTVRISATETADSLRSPNSPDSLGIGGAAGDEPPTPGLNPPPLAHLYALPARVADRARDSSSRPREVPLTPFRRPSSTLDFGDSASERTEWGPDRSDSLR